MEAAPRARLQKEQKQIMETMETYVDDRREAGFTLIELLIAIVVVGILTAVAIVGIAGLTNSGKSASCQSTIDASRAAVAVHYANTSPNAYPATFADMTGAKELTLQGGVTSPTANTLAANGWTITLAPTGGVLTATGASNCQ